LYKFDDLNFRKINKPKINNLLKNSVAEAEEADEEKFGIDNPLGIDDDDDNDDDEL
jgi:hypothetical protein